VPQTSKRYTFHAHHLNSYYTISRSETLMHDGKLLGVMKVLVSLFLSPVLGF
jgi:hypothetical protein